MKKHIYLSLILLIINNLSNAQIVTVKEKNSAQPLEMVTLIGKDSQKFSITNANGQADISAFHDNEPVIVRLLGYKSKEIQRDELSENQNIVMLEVSSLTIDNVVVSATRQLQATKDIPAKITRIGLNEIRLQNPQTAADLLAASGEVLIQKSQQGGGSPMIRGFATNRLLYTIDGVRMNTAIFRSGNLQNVISLDPFATENVEVLFGPASVIYGSDAIGGVMSFQTLHPQFSFSSENLITGKAITRYSSANNEKTAHFDINLGGKKWAAVTSFTTHNFDHLRMGSHGPDEYLRHFYVERHNNSDVVVANPDPLVQRPTGYSQVNMMQKFGFQPSENWNFTYGFHYSETSDYDRYDRHIRYRDDGSPRYGTWKYGPQKWQMNQLTIHNLAVNRLYSDATLRIAHQYFEESRISRDLNDEWRETRTEKVDAFSLNLDFTKKAGRRHNLYYGVETVVNQVDSKGELENIFDHNSMPGPPRYPQATWASYAAYLMSQFNMSEQLTLQAGVRYNSFALDATFDTSFYPFPYTDAEIKNQAITGSIGFVFKPGSNWIIHANASTGFRAPNVDDAGKVFDSEPGAVIVPNPDLKAEYAYNAEIGVTKLIAETVKIQLTGYYTILENALVRRDFILNGCDSIMYDGELSRVQAIQNAAEAQVYGLQGNIEVDLPGNFSFSSQANYQKGEEETDDGQVSPSRHASPWFGVSRLSYTQGRLNMQLYAMYSGEKRFEDMPESEKSKPYIYAIDDSGNPYSPAWYTLNFKVMYQFDDNFAINAGLENITGQRYKTYSSGIAAAGRNMILSLKINF